jgi:hypothetical protein
MRVRKSVAVFMLAAVVALTAFSQAGSAAVQRNVVPDQDRGLIGSWLLTVTFPPSTGLPTTTVMANFAASGVLTQVTLNPPGTKPGHGTWTPTGTNSFETTVWETTSCCGGPFVVRIDGAGMFTPTEINANSTFYVYLPTDLVHPVFIGASTTTGTRT